jgi:glycosyltransferase involved in cell wall biosynthesis
VLGRRLVSGRGAASLAAQVARDRLELGRLARDREAAIVHTNTSTIVSGQAVARRAGAAHLLHVREVYDGSAGKVGQWLWPLYRRHLLRADGLACVSRAAAAQFDACDRAFVLHDGITWVPRRAPRHEARRTLGIDPDRFAVAVIGRVSDWKGQDVLARALTEPPLAEIGAIGLVAGDPAPGQDHHELELIRLRDELGLGERFRLLGFREDLETVFGAADVVAAPSTHPDAFPNATLEAAVAGLPLVAVDSGGLPEIVRDGRTGKLVPQGDARRLAVVLRELAENPDQSRRLGDAAAADVRDRFGLQQMLDALQERYGRLLSGRD